VIERIMEDERAFAGSIPPDEERLRALAASVYDRARDPATAGNHWLLGGGEAVRHRFGEIAVPTLVVHGTDDPLFPLPHGEALAREIPGARLLALEGMGHEIPPPELWDVFVAALVEHTAA
jgi:pimeloyl-ACP methyl ester carboxylesterase